MLVAEAEAVAALRAAVSVMKDDFRVATRGGNDELLPPALALALAVAGAAEGFGGLLLWLTLAAPARLPLEELAVPELRRPNRKSMGEFEAVSEEARSTLATALASAITI